MSTSAPSHETTLTIQHLPGSDPVSFRVEKKPTSEGLLKSLVEKLINFQK
jgi:hypothetical protein